MSSKPNISKQESLREEEIDLQGVFHSIGNMFSGMGNRMVNRMAKIRKLTIEYRKLMYPLFILGLLAGIYKGFFAAPYFSSSIILSSEFLNTQISENAIDKLNTLSEDKNYEILAKTLNIDIQMAEKIRSIEVEAFITDEEMIDNEVLKSQLEELIVDEEDEEKIEELIEKIELENLTFFKIIVVVFDTEIINQLEQPLVDFFRNSVYIKKRIKNERENLLAKKKKLRQERYKLDSFKVALYQNILKMGEIAKEGSNNLILASEVADPVDIIEQDLLIYEEEQEVDTRLQVEDYFELVDSFASFYTSESPGPILSLIYAEILFMGFGYLIIFIMRANQYLARKQNELETTY